MTAVAIQNAHGSCLRDVVPFESAYEPSRRWLLTVATGRISMPDVREHLFERAKQKLAGPELIDTTRAELLMSPAELPHAAAVIRDVAALQLLGPTAILVQTDFARGMSLLLERLLIGVVDVRTFRSRGEAERWLTLGPFLHVR
jgi:hypothetical protein